MDAHGLYRRKDSPYWWCWFYDRRGQLVSASTKCTDKRAAAAARKRLEQEAQGVRGDAAADYPVKDAVMDFLERGLGGIAEGTKVMYCQKAGHLIRLLGEKDAGELHFDDVQGYIETRTAEGAHPHTVHKELVALRRVLGLAEQRQKRVANPRLIIPRHRAEYRPRERWLTEGEYTRLLAELEPHRADYVRVAVYTGGRKGEIDRLRQDHVNLRAGLIRLPGTKTDTAPRDIPIDAPLRRVLERLLAKKRRGLLQPWGNVDRDIPRACKRADLARVTCNDLRRTFASWMLQRGEEPMTVARLLGHASLNMVYRVYGQLEKRHLVRAVRRLPDPERKTLAGG